MNKQDNGAGKGIPISDDVAANFKIEAPINHADRLKARGSKLSMRAGQREDEKLVCLYDLVAWLVTDCDVPLTPAIDTVATTLEARDGDLFHLSRDDYATPHNPDSPFLKFTDERSLAATSVRVLGMPAYDLDKLTCRLWSQVNWPDDKPDNSVEFDESKETPFEYFGRMDSCTHALTWHKAYELFGWGSVVYAGKGQAAPAMNPPASWCEVLELDHGRSKGRYVQRADANTPLVRLVDVLTDLAARLGLPTGEAVGDFLAAVNVPLLQEVYWLRENRFAELVVAGFMYGFDTQAEAQRRTQEAADYADEMRWDLYGGKPAVYSWFTTPLEALKQHIQDHGPHTSDRSLYSVSHATANRLWGWGGVVAEQAVVPGAPVQDEAKEKEKWTPERLWVQLQKNEGDGRRKPMQRLAEQTGMADRTIRDHVKPYRKAANLANKNPRSVWRFADKAVK